MKVCVHFVVCKCSCHSEIDKLFELTGMTRIAQDNPEYIVDRSAFSMPTPEERIVSRASKDLELTGRTDAQPTLESPAPGIVPPLLARSFAATPTGRLARGQLEFMVREACDVWKVEGYSVNCTPQWIATEVAKTHGIDEPSTGAVSSVLMRWVNIGFATVDGKPFRFLDYTKEGMDKGLEVMKLAAKRPRSEKHRSIDKLTTKKRA
jgi:hypothetical protein